MPILVKDYTWIQTPKVISIRIPISPVNHEKVDVFTTDWYIKANFNPFLFEIFLLYEIDSKKSSCIVKEDLISLDLCKKEEKEWDSLEKELTKPEKMKIKEEVLKKCQEEAQKQAEDKRIQKTQLDRHAVQRAMDVDAKQHEIMDKRRNDERDKAMIALEEWRFNAAENEFLKATNSSIKNVAPKLEARDSGVKIVELDSSSDEEMKKPKKTAVSKSKIPPVREPPPRVVKSEYIDKKKEELNKRVLPKLRSTAEIEITHTARTFPTPSRESTADEEAIWLKNITLARRATGKIIIFRLIVSSTIKRFHKFIIFY